MTFISFSEILTESTKEKEIKHSTAVPAVPEGSPKIKVVDPAAVIRSMGIKIKLVLTTTFGTEYILAKKYEPEVIESLIKRLSPRKVKIKGTSIFVV